VNPLPANLLSLPSPWDQRAHEPNNTGANLKRAIDTSEDDQRGWTRWSTGTAPRRSGPTGELFRLDVRRAASFVRPVLATHT
jgi:hypothetical protein